MRQANKEIRLDFVFKPLRTFAGHEHLACILAQEEHWEYGRLHAYRTKALYLPHEPVIQQAYAYFKLATESDPFFPAYLRLRYREDQGTIFASLTQLYTFQANFRQHVEVAFDLMDDYRLWSELSQTPAPAHEPVPDKQVAGRGKRE